MDKETLVAVYSPVCEANGAFLGLLSDWTREAGWELELIPFHRLTDRELAWYKEAGRLDDRGFRQTVFIDVFLGGRIIDSVPLSRERVARALGLELSGEDVDVRPPVEEVTADSFLASFLEGRVRPVPITPETYRREMSMCLENYPFGSVDSRFHDCCRALKEPVFEDTFRTQEMAGVFLEQVGGPVVGLLEVHPREVLRKYGFAAGRESSDEDCLTVGCYEVGRGFPRAEVIDRLMASLLKLGDRLGRPRLEGVGRMGWPGGFNPLWVYDKYGFQVAEELRPGWKVMRRDLSE